MTYEEIKKYEGYIKYLATLKASRYIEPEDLIQSAKERLIKLKISKKHIYKIIRNAILRECKKQLPNPYRCNYQKKYPLIPEHSEFNEHDTPPPGTTDKVIDKIYFQEKLKEILRVATKREKQFIYLFLKDLNPLEIARKMKIDHRCISEIVKKIKNKIGRNAQTL